MPTNNPFTSPETAANYEAWYQTVGRTADRQEKALLKWLLSKFKAAHSILEIGSGTGHFTRWFGEQGLLATGLDSSRPMLEEAIRLKSPVCLQGDAALLPFRSSSIDLVALITTLEFLPDPIVALTEAIRVAREGLILGVLNAQSRLGRQYKREAGPIWEAAHFYTPNELKRVVEEIAGDKPKTVWRTTLWSCWQNALPLPWGGFIGMAVKLH
ncbi:MAG: class I SAM-dependent methyltransferase [Anaerolineales bacterium]|nr:class I SAM-dependent methyltransferase [Anaerolineales bacterium]